MPSCGGRAAENPCTCANSGRNCLLPYGSSRSLKIEEKSRMPGGPSQRGVWGPRRRAFTPRRMPTIYTECVHAEHVRLRAPQGSPRRHATRKKEERHTKLDSQRAPQNEVSTLRGSARPLRELQSATCGPRGVPNLVLQRWPEIGLHTSWGGG